jgi:hypothetical protein
MKKHYRHENDCLNCGAELQGHFCHVCGQENLEIKEGFGHMMGHAISDYFHFDQQFFQTLKPLLFKPGFLTKEYMAGRRVHYLHPVKMYIFISVVFFLLYFRDSNKLVEVQQTPTKQTNEKVADTAKTTVDSAIARDKNLSSVQKKKLEKIATHFKQNGVNVRFGKPNFGKPAEVQQSGDLFTIMKDQDSTYAEYVAHQQELPEEERDGFIERSWNKKKYDYNAKYGKRAGEVFFDEFKHNVPKMMFLLVPISALILMVTFRKNRKFYIEHLIFSFHLHCFLFLFLAIVMLLESAFPAAWVTNSLTFISFFVIVWYMYRSLRVIYHRTIFRTITKMIGMYFMYLISLSFCVTFVALITALIT